MLKFHSTDFSTFVSTPPSPKPPQKKKNNVHIMTSALSLNLVQQSCLCEQVFVYQQWYFLSQKCIHLNSLLSFSIAVYSACAKRNSLLKHFLANSSDQAMDSGRFQIHFVKIVQTDFPQQPRRPSSAAYYRNLVNGNDTIL